jgi:hypothetical protein
LFGGITKVVSVVQKFLVSVSLGGGGGDNTLLGDNALVQVGEFTFKFLLLGFEVGNDLGDSAVFSFVSSLVSFFVSQNLGEVFFPVL